MTDDLTPKFNSLPADQEVVLPNLVSDTTNQPIGGFMASPNGLTQGNVTLDGTGEKILLGAATSPTVGTGIFMGNDGAATKGYDFRVGDPAAHYIWWDASANTLTIVGAVTATSIDIPDTVTANSFHVDSNGNAWWGATTLGSATAKVLNTGVATFTNIAITGGSVDINGLVNVSSAGVTTLKSYNLIKQYTAGEAVTAGHLGCLINKEATWGDDASADRNTTATMAAMTYVDGAAATTAFGATSIVKLGLTGGGTGTAYILGKLDLSGNPPGLPAWNEIETVKLRIYVAIAASGSATALRLTRLTGAFTEATVTFNTRPAEDTLAWSGATTCVAVNGETVASAADGLHTGYVEFEITDLYRLWSQGTYSNFGFQIQITSTQTTYVQMGGRTRTGGGVFNQAPFVLEIIRVNNPGAGNTITACDGKIYQADNTKYQRVKMIAGIIGQTVSAAATCDVYTLADRSIIPTSVLTVVAGKTYYLTATDGTIGTLTNDIIETGKYDIRVGDGTASGLSVNMDKSPIYISTTVYLAPVLPPPNARMAIVHWFKVASTRQLQGNMVLEKPFSTDVIYTTLDASSNLVTVEATWATGISGLITLTGIDSGGTSSIDWYR